jgi:hypothetical protein
MDEIGAWNGIRDEQGYVDSCLCSCGATYVGFFKEKIKLAALFKQRQLF